MTTVLETYSGRFFDYNDPRPEAVCVEDIARALSMTARFRGHTLRYLSVAEHAVLVAFLVDRAEGTPAQCFAALHHDSHEAYLGDLPTPLKAALGPAYRSLAASVDDAILDGLDFPVESSFGDPLIKACDEAALFLEAAAVKRSGGVGLHWNNDFAHIIPGVTIHCYSADEAEYEFLRAHHKLAARCAR